MAAATADRPSIQVEIDTRSYNAPKKNCVTLEMRDGTVRFVRILRPAGLNARKHIQARVRVYTRTAFVEDAPDGVYNWIFGDNDFFAVPVLSLFEYGTLHKQIAEQTGTRRIFFAGECWKEGELVRFNTLSGTFTKILVEEGGQKAAEDINKWSGEMFETMGFGAVMQEKGARATFIREPFISLKEEELAFYKSLGFKVDLYRGEEACRGMRRSFLEAQIRQREAMFKGEPGFFRKVKLSAEIEERLKGEIADFQGQLAALEQPSPWAASASASPSRSPKTRKRPRTNQ
jgi:hypothetical protein